MMNARARAHTNDGRMEKKKIRERARRRSASMSSRDDDGFCRSIDRSMVARTTRNRERDRWRTRFSIQACIRPPSSRVTITFG